MISAFASTVEIALVTTHSFAPNSYKLLDPLINIPGFYIFAILLCYIIEILRPQWLNIKRLLLIFLPSIPCAAVVLLFVVKGDITMLNSIDDLHSHIAKPNVIARLVFLGMYIPCELCGGD